MPDPAPHENHRPVISVLLAAPTEDQIALSNIVVRSDWPLCPEAQWKLKPCATLQSAFRRLLSHDISIVICDSDLGPGAWIKLLDRLGPGPGAPFLIVTSRLADDHLWAEALNLGAYDVLAKPFDSAEVVRTLSLAWLHWAHRRERTRPLMKKPLALEGSEKPASARMASQRLLP